MSKRLTKLFSGAKKSRGSSSRSAASAANAAYKPEEEANAAYEPEDDGVYVSNKDPLHSAAAFPPHPQRDVDEEIMRYNAQIMAHNKIFGGEFSRAETKEEVKMLVAEALDSIYAGESLTVEEKEKAAEKGIREAFKMFTFSPNK